MGASFDTPADNRRFAEEQGFPYPLLCDVDRRLAVAYRAARDARDAYPRRITYVIGPDGRIETALETQDPGAQAGVLLESLGGDRAAEGRAPPGISSPRRPRGRSSG